MYEHSESSDIRKLDRDLEERFDRGGGEGSYDDRPIERPKSTALPWLLFVLTLAGAGTAAYYGWDKLEAEKARAEAAQARVSESSGQLTKQNNSLSELKAKIDQLEKEKDDLRAAQMQLEGQVKVRDEELARLKSTYDALQDKMKKEIGSGDIRLTQAGGKLQVDFIDKILFDSGDATISKRGEEVLGRVGAVLATITDKQITVSGHTDNARITEKLQETYPTNWELSAARAINVVRFLQEKAGVPEKMINASAYGPYHPIASNNTPQGRARNRRIEILLTPSIEPISRPNALKNATAPRK
jgi:chemotaxis protein MotB